MFAAVDAVLGCAVGATTPNSLPRTAVRVDRGAVEVAGPGRVSRCPIGAVGTARSAGAVRCEPVGEEPGGVVRSRCRSAQRVWLLWGSAVAQAVRVPGWVARRWSSQVASSTVLPVPAGASRRIVWPVSAARSRDRSRWVRGRVGKARSGAVVAGVAGRASDGMRCCPAVLISSSCSEAGSAAAAVTSNVMATSLEMGYFGPSGHPKRVRRGGCGRARMAQRQARSARGSRRCPFQGCVAGVVSDRVRAWR